MRTTACMLAGELKAGAGWREHVVVGGESLDGQQVKPCAVRNSGKSRGVVIAPSPLGQVSSRQSAPRRRSLGGKCSSSGSSGSISSGSISSGRSSR